jgi:hypothetical protein
MIFKKDETYNLIKFANFQKFIFIQQWLTQNIYYIETTICIFINKLQNISFQTYFNFPSYFR